MKREKKNDYVRKYYYAMLYNINDIYLKANNKINDLYLEANNKSIIYIYIGKEQTNDIYLEVKKK